MDTSTAILRVLDQLADLLDRTADTPPTAPTPCTDFDVAALRGHIVGWLSAFTDGYTSDDHLCGDPGSVVVEESGAEQVRRFAARLAEVFPDALASPLKIGDAAMPGDVAASMILWEYQVHGWDLARAAGVDWTPRDEDVEASLAFAPGMLTPDFQGEGKAFGPRVDVAADAPAIDRLAGLSGRDPRV